MSVEMSHNAPAAVSTIERARETDPIPGAKPSQLGPAFTFAVNDCPIRVTRRGSMLDVRLVGHAVAGNCEQIRRVLLAVLATARPVTLDLRDLDHVDVVSARMLTRIVEAAEVKHRDWAVVGPDPHAPTSCVEQQDRSHMPSNEPIAMTRRSSFTRAC